MGKGRGNGLHGEENQVGEGKRGRENVKEKGAGERRAKKGKGRRREEKTVWEEYKVGGRGKGR